MKITFTGVGVTLRRNSIRKLKYYAFVKSYTSRIYNFEKA